MYSCGKQLKSFLHCTLKTASTPHIRVAPERTEVANGCEVVVAAGNVLL